MVSLKEVPPESEKHLAESFWLKEPRREQARSTANLVAQGPVRSQGCACQLPHGRSTHTRQRCCGSQPCQIDPQLDGQASSCMRLLEEQTARAYHEARVLDETRATMQRQLQSCPPQPAELYSWRRHNGSPQRHCYAAAPCQSELAHSHVASRHALFNMIDRNADGVITRAELANALNCTSPVMDNNDSAGAREELFRLLDANRDGVVTMDEFFRALDGPLAGQALFQALDRDNSGSITTAEFQAALGCRFVRPPGAGRASTPRRAETPQKWFVDTDGRQQSHMPIWGAPVRPCRHEEPPIPMEPS
eukprot:5921195-Amphidinium_carterae.2